MKKSILDQAVAVALSSDAPKKMGAILLYKNRILCAATNSYHRTSPVQYWAAQNAAKVWNNSALKKKIYCHAEISAIIKNRTGQEADTIIIARVGGHGSKKGNHYELRMAFPCPICYTYITEKTNIKNIYYSTNENNFEHHRF